MKLARRAMNDPERLRELEASLDDKVSELLAEANDAGYGTDEATTALLRVVNNQALIARQDRHTSDELLDDVDRNADPHPLGTRNSKSVS